MIKNSLSVGVTALALCSLLSIASCKETNEGGGSTPGTTTEVPAASAANGPHNFGGAIDTVTCEVIAGWVWNSMNPSQNIKVDIFADGKLLGTVPANRPRPDLLPDLGKFGATGNYGFIYGVPAALRDGQPHMASARVSGDTADLKVWEKIKGTFTCK